METPRHQQLPAHETTPNASNPLLCVSELLLIYAAVPLLTAALLEGIFNLIPLLLIAAVLCFLLLRSSSFDNKRFVSVVPVNWKLMGGRFLLLSGLAYGFVRIFHQDLLYYLPQENLDRYVLAVALYPFWSVIPQEIIYRGWYFHRYSGLFPNTTSSVVLNSAFFSLSHIVFGNWVAVGGAFLVNFVFIHTYRKYNSLLIVVLEHFLYGVMIFSLGLGKFFR